MFGGRNPKDELQIVGVGVPSICELNHSFNINVDENGIAKDSQRLVQGWNPSNINLKQPEHFTLGHMNLGPTLLPVFLKHIPTLF